MGQMQVSFRRVHERSTGPEADENSGQNFSMGRFYPIEMYWELEKKKNQTHTHTLVLQKTKNKKTNNFPYGDYLNVPI